MHLVDCIDHQDVHEVVRVANEVQPAGEPALGNVDASNKTPNHRNYILKGHKKIPTV